MWPVFRLRSIRRKLFWSLALVMAALGVQAGGGISGLLSYRSLIRDLDHEFSHGPRIPELLAAISAVYEPLVWEQAPQFQSGNPDEQLAASRLTKLQEEQTRVERQEVTLARLTHLKSILQQYHRRLDDESLPPDRRLLTNTLLFNAEVQLASLLRVATRLSDPDQTQGAIVSLQNGLAKLKLTILTIPPARNGFENRVDAARDIFRSRLWMIVGATIGAVVLFFVVVTCAYRWIFKPIRALHQGASRVAQGDFTYRLKVRGNDEMAELAAKFNQMTARFEEIRDDLDKEVRERTKQALRSERLAGVGFLSAGVAHEINNPLSAIAMAAESLEYRIQEAQAGGTGLPADDLGVLTQYLGMIQRESFRCQQITQRLLSFARGHDQPRMQTDLTQIVGEVLDMVSHMSRFRGYDIVFDRGKSVYLTVNGAEIKQVVLNLVANALESMSETGRLEIAIIEQADEVLLTFRDNGCGMTPHVLENLFEPFFTAKASGRGTGLGLSITHRIVNDHGGRIEATSDGPGTGSTFLVHLPRRAAQALAA